MHLLVLVLTVMSVLTVDSSVEARPALRVVSKDPLAVSGQGFKAGERIRLIALGSLERVSVRTTANGRGLFKARFRALPGDRCSRLVVAAVGSRGSRASVKVTRRPCTPARVPPPRS